MNLPFHDNANPPRKDNTNHRCRDGTNHPCDDKANPPCRDTTSHPCHDSTKPPDLANGCESLTPITDILPHRPPFLFVTRAISIQQGRWAVAEYDVPRDHVLFRGHFPQEPVFPGVITLEMMAQTAALAVLSEPGRRGKPAYLAAIENARFKQPVKPGDTLRAEVEVEPLRMNVCRARGKAFVAGREVAAAVFVFALGV
ncbi:MAG: 3-hydroxyacyl-ACP dehydratase FabZ [Firmicutes bacterium]|nr:3-hydroxyacyl-ACP dehydratase FabZ [Candidatus Fermentithermobacillaceae bacterium]